jgi:spermidine synthase
MRKNLRTVLVATAFFLTGGCGLVYESLWTRYLSELTGGTALSQLIVLIVFMGGLALGAMLIGRFVDSRPGRGLFIYAILELGVGGYAILFPVLHKIGTISYLTLGTDLESGTFGLLIIKVLLSLMLIILPSVAMGGTLPAVTRYLTNNHEEMRVRISLLYGINSLGAVLGILLAGFFLVYHFGMNASMQYTGAFNMLVGFAAFILAYVTRSDEDSSSESKETNGDEHLTISDHYTYTSAEIRQAIIIAGFSGFAAMALQVIWIRYFLIFLGATHSSFTIVVAAFIFGIGVGSLIVRTRIVGRFRLTDVLLVLLIVTTVSLYMELFIYSRLPFETGRLLGIFARIPFAWPFYSVTKFGILFLVMLPVTIVSGMILPVCIRICEKSDSHIGRDVAKVYAINTIASLLGILVAGQLFFRIFDLPQSLRTIMFIYLAMSGLLAFSPRLNKVKKPLLAALAFLLITHIFIWKPWLPTELFIYRIDFGYAEPIFHKDFLKFIGQKRIIDDLHGPDAHVTVLEGEKDVGIYRSMFINGKPDAGTAGDMPIQVMTGQLPVLLHPDPRNVFLLGLGSGVSSGEILKHQSIEKVTTVELAKEVFDASKSFEEYNGKFWENPRHRLIIDDGMNTLRLSKEKYDVIILQPTNVWQAGMPGLFSEDFFKIVRSRLRTGGLAAQWMQTYLVDDRSVNLVLKTFSTVFPDSSIFQFDRNNILLVGYDKEWNFNPDSMVRRFNQPTVYETMVNAGNKSPEAMLLREVMDRETFLRYSSVLDIPINTLNFPVLEQAAEYGLFMQEASEIIQILDSRNDPDSKDMLVNKYIRGNSLTPEQITVLIDSEHVRNNQKLRNSLVFMLLDKTWSRDQQAPPIKVYSYLDDAQLREIVTHPGYRKPPGQMTADEAYNLLGAELMIWHNAASQLWQPDHERLKQLFARVAEEANHETAARVARDAGVSLSYSGACEEALPFFRFAVDVGNLGPEGLSPGELSVLFSCEVKEGDPEKALQWWQLIEENQMEVAPAMRRDKLILDIKLGGAPPPPFHGRLPDRW